MAILWIIAVASLLTWVLGMALLSEFSPWIHVPLLIALLAMAAAARRPRMQRRS